MIRTTSVAAYRAIRDGGLLKRAQFDVYSHLWSNGPLTGGELNRGMGSVTHSYHKRLTELEAVGVAYRVGVRVCRVSGRRCETWDVTDKLPESVKPKARPRRPSADAIEHAASILRGFYLTKPDVVPVADWLESFGPAQRRLPLDSTRPAA